MELWVIWKSCCAEVTQLPPGELEVNGVAGCLEGFMNCRVLNLLTTAAAQLVAVRQSQWPIQSTTVENLYGEELGGLVSLKHWRVGTPEKLCKRATVQSAFNLWGKEKGEERVVVLDPTLSFDFCVLEEEKDKNTDMQFR